MNKGTAIVGFLLSFIAGMFLMWGIDNKSGGDITKEGPSGGAADHSLCATSGAGLCLEHRYLRSGLERREHPSRSGQLPRNPEL